MRPEIELILLGVLCKRSEEEEKRLQKVIESNLDWAWITGQLIRHRIDGNFYNGILKEQRGYIVDKVRQAMAMLSNCYEAINKINLQCIQELFVDLNKTEIKTAGLKGVIYNTQMYGLNVRRSNDIDILVAEKDLKTMDKVMREHGFIQSFDGGRTEASKKDKLMQLMNHHDLVPYFKRIELPYMDCIKVDVNFQFDSKENEITNEILENGLATYEGNGYVVQGLVWPTHLAHLCVHFYREASNSLWTSKVRDVALYKIVDVENSFREYSEEQLVEWTDTIRKFGLEKQCYFTLFYVNNFYPSDRYKKIMELIQPEDLSYINQIKINGEDRIVERKTSFFEQAFDMNYGENFMDRDLTKVY